VKLQKRHLVAFLQQLRKKKKKGGGTKKKKISRSFHFMESGREEREQKPV